MQDSSNSIANALELLQSWTKPSMYLFAYWLILAAPFYCDDERRDFDDDRTGGFLMTPIEAMDGLLGTHTEFRSTEGSTSVTLMMDPAPREMTGRLVFKAAGATVISIEAFSPDQDAPVDTETVGCG